MANVLNRIFKSVLLLILLYSGKKLLQNLIAIYRKRISLVRTSIAARNILLWNPSLDSSSPNFAFKESILPTLIRLLKTQSLYLIHQVSSDAEEIAIKSLYYSSGLYSSGLNPNQVLFCDTTQGLLHMVRHLSPTYHLDDDYNRISQLNGIIPGLVLVKTFPNYTLPDTCHIKILESFNEWK